MSAIAKYPESRGTGSTRTIEADKHGFNPEVCDSIITRDLGDAADQIRNEILSCLDI